MFSCKITIMVILILPHLPGLHKISKCPGLAAKDASAFFF